MKSLIYGYGETGKSFERYLKKQNVIFDVYDDNHSQFSSKVDFSSYKTIYCSPGIKKSIFDKLKKNKNIVTDLDIFFKFDKSIKIGITGTNRKSTTAHHLFQIFQDYQPTNLIGNIGIPMLDFINNGKKFSILELSSFQLDKMIVNKLDYGILLNLEEDHIDYHGSIEEYKKSKRKILEAKNQISYEDNPYKLFTWVTKTNATRKNLKNLPYRLEKINKNTVNDSKSTNYHSLIYAIQNAKKIFNSNDYHLIVCGDPGKERFRKIKVSGPNKIYIVGKHANEIDKCLSHPNKRLFVSLKHLFKSKAESFKNTNILFSPGYPSGKDYKNFEERGENFNFLIKKYIDDK